MTPANEEQVGRGIQILTRGLKPFVIHQLQDSRGEAWKDAFPLPPGQRDKSKADPPMDAQALLAVMWDEWNRVFKPVLGHAERNLVSELREVRNRWAHQEPFSTADAYRALDSMSRMLKAVGAPEAKEVQSLLQNVLHKLSAKSSAVPGGELENRGTNSERLLSMLKKVYPDWRSNSQLAKETGIKPHQQVFQITQRLRERAAIESERRGNQWFFRCPPC